MRVNFSRLVAEHTFAYERLEFDFVSGIYSIVGANGASKSSIYLCVAQCLFNRNPKGTKIDDVSNDVTGKPSVITLEWENAHGDRYQVINSRREVSITVNLWSGTKWKSIGKKRIPENLKLIEELLGVSYETFCMLTFQDTASNLDLVEESTDTARKNFANKVLQFGELDRLLTVMKTAAKDLKKEADMLSRQADSFERGITPLKEVGRLRDVSALEAELHCLRQDIIHIRPQLSTLREELARIKGQGDKAAEWTATQDRITVIEEGLARFDSAFPSAQAAHDRLDELDRLAETCRVRRSDAEQELKKLRRPVKPDAPEMTCSRCGHALDNAEAVRVYAQDMERYETASEAYTHQKMELNRTIADCALESATIEEERLKVSAEVRKWGRKSAYEDELHQLRLAKPPEFDERQLEGRISALKIQISELTYRLGKTEELEKTAQFSLTEAVSYNKVQEAVVGFNAEAEENNQRLRIEIAEKRRETGEVERKLDLVNHWVSLLGPKGYRVHKMVGFLKLLNAAMVKYSKMISGGKISCLFYVTEDGRIEFTVTDADKSKPFANWSNGEKARVKLSCLFAVLEILELMGSTSFNLLFLDEIFSALDDEGKEGLFRVLAYLRDKGKCVYTISHSPLVNSVVFDRILKVSKENGLATVE